MKATLVSHYGNKSDELSAYLRQLQEYLSNSFSTGFRPYSLEQIHATIIGFESPGAEPASILSLLRSAELPSFEIQIGGYAPSRDYGFLSQAQHPAVRSFSVQQDTAVAMGWPGGGANDIDRLRRSFNRINIRHKWHQSKMDIDNDFYFVLGRLNRNSLGDGKIEVVEQKVRSYMAAIEPLILTVDSGTLAVVFYQDPELPRDTSVAYAITDKSFTVDDFQVYIDA